ncbi:hypothetical protein ARMGADRAFT_1038937 [Armillaria gallica]|uniref:Uncharacterized protein n=1 Tax=Armillaria gallica TaxID=47427 RepID=A0A2H3CL28_ARMGA|nr:hypothetical protein ARMGADRAFT_1038937 [Armillaria gallica]
MLHSILKALKLLGYIIVVLGPAHYYLYTSNQNNPMLFKGVDLFAYLAMWAFTLAEIDIGYSNPDRESVVVPVIRVWLRDSLIVMFLGCMMALLLYNFTAGTIPILNASPSLLPGYADALSCTNHSCHIIDKQDPTSYQGISTVLIEASDHTSETQILLETFLPKIPGTVDMIDIEVSSRCGSVTFNLMRVTASICNGMNLNDTSPLNRYLLYVLSWAIDPLETLLRSNDFLRGGDVVPDDLSPTMFMMLGGWNALILEGCLVVANLNRVLDKLGNDFHLTVMVQRAMLHAERSIHLYRMGDNAEESLQKLGDLEGCLEALQLVEQFQDGAWDEDEGGKPQAELVWHSFFQLLLSQFAGIMCGTDIQHFAIRMFSIQKGQHEPMLGQ